MPRTFAFALFIFFITFSAVLPCSSYAEESVDVSEEVQATDASKPIIVMAETPHFEIKLPRNATTGYQWFLLDDVARRFSTIHQSYQATDSNGKVGAGGMDIWVFRLSPSAFKYPHIIQLHFIYARPSDISNRDLNLSDQKVFTLVIAK